MPPPKFVFFVDQEKFESDHETVSVRQVLVEFAKEDAASTTLVERVGHETIKHTDLDEIIHLKNGMKFVVFHNSPTPVS
jgi:hypothetical protein